MLYGLVFFTGDGKATPKLGIDLQGGTRVTLSARTAEGAVPPREQLVQAQAIIEERVNGLGVSGAEVVLDGNNLTITVPGEEGDQARSLGQTAQLRFREVLGQPIPAPRGAGTPGAGTTGRSHSRPRTGPRPGEQPASPVTSRRGRGPGPRSSATSPRSPSRPRCRDPPRPPRAGRRDPGGARAAAGAGPAPAPGRPTRRRRLAAAADPELAAAIAQARETRQSQDPAVCSRRSSRSTARPRTRCAATTTRRSRWSPATRTAPRSTSSARPSSKAPRSSRRRPSRTSRASDT